MHTHPSHTNRLVASGLGHVYGDPASHPRVLDRVFLEFGANGPEAVAVMGPSGSGKSTLLHALAGIVAPTEGSVTWRGRDLASLGDAERTRLRRSEFGFVFQSGQLLPELPAVENVALPLLLSGQPRGQAESVARELLARLGLAGMESRRPGELSGGQAQRVAIARALVGSPGIVFADEPTGALDRSTGNAVMSLLIGATLGHGASLIVVTHDPEVAAACSRIVRLQDGRVVGDERVRDAGATPSPAPHAHPTMPQYAQPHLPTAPPAHPPLLPPAQPPMLPTAQPPQTSPAYAPSAYVHPAYPPPSYAIPGQSAQELHPESPRSYGAARASAQAPAESEWPR